MTKCPVGCNFVSKQLGFYSLKSPNRSIDTNLAHTIEGNVFRFVDLGCSDLEKTRFNFTRVGTKLYKTPFLPGFGCHSNDSSCVYCAAKGVPGVFCCSHGAA